MSTATIGSALVERRRELGLEKGQAADKIGMSRTTYSSYEQDAQRPSVQVFPAIADFLNISIEELLTLYGATCIAALRSALASAGGVGHHDNHSGSSKVPPVSSNGPPESMSNAKFSVTESRAAESTALVTSASERATHREPETSSEVTSVSAEPAALSDHATSAFEPSRGKTNESGPSQSELKSLVSDGRNSGHKKKKKKHKKS